MGKVVSARKLITIRRGLRKREKVVVFTNGTFDILHRGHVEYLKRAKAFGDILVIGLNTDASIKRIKGNKRPINPGADRAVVLAALEPVDYVCFFGEETPRRLIQQLLPDVLVKGADWNISDIVGKDIVERNGGAVRRVRLTPGRSTTNVIKRILTAYS